MRPKSPNYSENSENSNSQKRTAKSRINSKKAIEAIKIKNQEEKDKLRAKIDLARIVRNNPVCIMADPALVSDSRLPYIDFINIGLRENKNDTSLNPKSDGSKGGKMLRLNQNDLQKYYHSIAWTKRLHRNPIT